MRFLTSEVPLSRLTLRRLGPKPQEKNLQNPTHEMSTEIFEPPSPSPTPQTGVQPAAAAAPQEGGARLPPRRPPRRAPGDPATPDPYVPVVMPTVGLENRNLFSGLQRGLWNNPDVDGAKTQREAILQGDKWIPTDKATNFRLNMERKKTKLLLLVTNKLTVLWGS